VDVNGTPRCGLACQGRRSDQAGWEDSSFGNLISQTAESLSGRGRRGRTGRRGITTRNSQRRASGWMGLESAPAEHRWHDVVLDVRKYEAVASSGSKQVLKKQTAKSAKPKGKKKARRR
jgi:hypothetical protein